MSTVLEHFTTALNKKKTIISANADGPSYTDSSKIDHIALPTEYNYYRQRVLVDSKLLHRPQNVGY